MEPNEEEAIIRQQLELRDDELLWHGSPPPIAVPSPLYFTAYIIAAVLIVAGVGGLIVRHAVISFSSSKGFLASAGIVLLSIIVIVATRFYTDHHNTVIYGFTKKKAFWIHRSSSFVVHELPFSDIQKIDLVGRMDDPTVYTIYFSPNKQLDFGGYNYRKDTERPFPTFELLKHGDKVYKKLNEALMAYRNEG
ncbi:MAG: hypothetical protein IT258_08790 [Saprospiraceae bacterium]|nr:hypothetical protein [Saprospiraceae bacterium]